MESLPPIDRSAPVARAAPPPPPPSPPLPSLLRSAADRDEDGGRDPRRPKTLSAALQRALDGGAPALARALAEGRGLGERFGSLVEELERAALLGGEAGAPLARAREELLALAVIPEAGGAALLSALLAGGTFSESQGLAAGRFAGLKPLLWSLLDPLGAPPGVTRRARDLLGAVEREQWLALWAAERGEHHRAVCAARLAGRWATLCVRWPRREPLPGGEAADLSPGPQPGQGTARLTVEFDAGDLGRVEARLLLAGGRLLVRVGASDGANLGEARARLERFARECLAQGLADSVDAQVQGLAAESPRDRGPHWEATG